jgi:hypothetical protein
LLDILYINQLPEDVENTLEQLSEGVGYTLELLFAITVEGGPRK